MKMSITSYDTTATIECPDDADVFEAFKNAMSMLRSIGYQPESIEDAIVSAADEIVGDD